MKPNIQYIPDQTVDEALDAEIRDLLTACFKKPQDYVFEERRYFLEPYPHRWVIRGEEGKLAAHIGVHEKHIDSGNKTYSIAGICEVCVRPDHRGNGYVKMMLENIHSWLASKNFVFAVLFGAPAVYQSSGYREVSNLFYGGGEEGWKAVAGMAHELTDVPWPEAEVHLPGPKF